MTFGNLNLPPEWYGALEWVFPEWARKHAFDKGEAVNHMKGAIVTSDRLLTVSQVRLGCSRTLWFVKLRPLGGPKRNPVPGGGGLLSYDLEMQVC